VQSFTSSTHISNWQFGRTVAGAQEDPALGISLFDQPHKVVGYATYTLNWLKRLSTDVTLSYQGVSGPAHDYIYASGSTGLGDLNADGFQGNDLLYVPTSATDPTQIQFRTATFTNAQGQRISVSAADQAAAFQRLIDSSECLASQRGQIMTRNSCRQPFFNQFDLNLRQSLPEFAGQRISIQLDVFNFGNLLNKEWGQQLVTPQSGNSNVPLVTHVGQSSADARTAVPIVTYNPFTFETSGTTPNEYQAGNFAGNFWRMQLSLRLSF
jgi:hypothetical protein